MSCLALRSYLFHLALQSYVLYLALQNYIFLSIYPELDIYN